MKNIHIITFLAAGLFLAAAIATYRPSASSFSVTPFGFSSVRRHTRDIV